METKNKAKVAPKATLKSASNAKAEIGKKTKTKTNAIERNCHGKGGDEDGERC
jgi:hypothetical protein